MSAILAEIRADISAVQTEEFFVAGQAKRRGERRPLELEARTLPPAFIAFTTEFAGLKAFHDPSDGGRYRLKIWGQLYLLENARTGRKFAEFGRHREQEIGFGLSPNGGIEAEPIIAIDANGLERRVAQTFESWLESAWRSEKAALGRRRWAELVAGPAAFTAAELAILKARDEYRIELISPCEPGSIEFLVENHSALQLAHVTAGFRYSDDEILPMRVDVGSIAPGKTGRVKQRFPYSNLTPDRICRFPIEPTPANRALFWELRSNEPAT